MSMSASISGPRRVKVWQADAEWPDDTYVVPAEDYDLIEVDRDIKAANLQLLVENVLACEEACTRCEDQGNDGADVYEAGLLWSDLLNLARSLKK